MKPEMNKDIPVLLLAWYDAHARVLPWRKKNDPYRIWVSEIMLQQTRAETVLPYYEKFIGELPDIRALAAAPEERVFKLWQGLGYYRRARNMQLAAKIVAETLGGILPSTAEELKKLPGIGEYTAGAIASIAFNRRTSAVDGNVLRIVARLYGIADSIEDRTVASQIRDIVTGLLPDTRVGDFNQALMDLGATVCLPNGEPLCKECPLAEFCEAHNRNLTSVLPKRSDRPQRPRQDHTVLILECQGRFALQKRPENVLLASLWQFPMLQGASDFGGCKKALPFLTDDAVLSVAPIPSHRHIFSHLQWDLAGYFIRLKEIPCDAPYIWAAAEDIRKNYSVPSAFKPYMKIITGE
jgi:A/G-specific adenine glycosylase